MNSLPERIQLSRKKGWRKPPDTIVVSRPTKWGNPIAIHKDGYRSAISGNGNCVLTSTEAVARFTAAVGPNGPSWGVKMFFLARRELRGKNLACWCPIGAPCHADVLLEIANAP